MRNVSDAGTVRGGVPLPWLALKRLCGSKVLDA